MSDGSRSSSSNSSSSALAAIREQLKKQVLIPQDTHPILAVAAVTREMPPALHVADGSVRSGYHPPAPSSKASLTHGEIEDVNRLLWGASTAQLSWKQGFFFNAKPGLEFGLLQKQGGPCGVLAAVQAHLIAESMLQPGTRKVFWSFDFAETDAQDGRLVDAFCSILWQASEGDSVVLVSPLKPRTRDLSYKDLLQNIERRTVSRNATSIKDVLYEVLPHYKEEDGWGLMLFLFSLLLSKGPEQVRSEMDDAEMCLIGEHAYCSQELVNLLLTGRAATNVFDGNKSFGDLDTEDCYLLKGIPETSKLGLLTLLEWNGYVEVGRHLKCPKFPVWVICAESHFTVLFSNKMTELRVEDPFQLIHYDGLSSQTEPQK